MEKPLETIEAGRYRIDIFHDDDPSNPFEDWDGCVPLMIEAGRGSSQDYGGVEDAILSALDGLDTDGLDKVAALLYDGEAMQAEAREYAEGDDRDLYAEGLRDEIREGMPSGSGKLDYLAAICDGLGWPCLNTSSHGWSQGDWADVLAVWLPAFARENRPGATPEDIRKELRDAVELWGWWAWGSVYGYTVTDTVTDEQVGSCWGFYGPDHEASGLLESATDEAQCAEQEQRRLHAGKVKA